MLCFYGDPWQIPPLQHIIATTGLDEKATGSYAEGIPLELL